MCRMETCGAERGETAAYIRPTGRRPTHMRPYAGCFSVRALPATQPAESRDKKSSQSRGERQRGGGHGGRRGPLPAARRRRRGGAARRRLRLPRPPRAPRRLRRLALRLLRLRGGDRGQLRLLRRVGEPDHVPDGAAGPLQRRRGRRRQRLVGDGLPHAAAGRLRRRLLARPLPLHHPRLHPLRPGLWHDHSCVHALGAGHPFHFPPFVDAGGPLLRLALPHSSRAGSRQAVRPSLRRRPVRCRPPQGARVPQLPLQLVVLLDGHRHLRRRRRRQLHPGERRMGDRLRHALCHYVLRLHRLPLRHPHLPHVCAQPRRREPLRPPRSQPCGAREELELLPYYKRMPRRGCHGQIRGGAWRAAIVADLGGVPGIRRGIRADHDAVQQAGPHPGPAHLRRPGAATGGASDVGASEHHVVRPHLRSRTGAGAGAGDGQAIGADSAPARGRGHGGVDVRGDRGSTGGGSAAGDGAGARAGGRRRRDGADELGVAGAAVRDDGRGGRADGGGLAGVLLRPDAPRAAQPRPGALLQRHGRRRFHQQRPHLIHRQCHQKRRRRRRLVRRQPQPRSPRLLLLVACRPLGCRARALCVARQLLCLQQQPQEASALSGHGDPSRLCTKMVHIVH